MDYFNGARSIELVSFTAEAPVAELRAWLTPFGIKDCAHESVCVLGYGLRFRSSGMRP
jgi:hypothetical protein